MTCVLDRFSFESHDTDNPVIVSDPAITFNTFKSENHSIMLLTLFRKVCTYFGPSKACAGCPGL